MVVGRLRRHLLGGSDLGLHEQFDPVLDIPPRQTCEIVKTDEPRKFAHHPPGLIDGLRSRRLAPFPRPLRPLRYQVVATIRVVEWYGSHADDGRGFLRHLRPRTIDHANHPPRSDPPSPD